ncbi:hypothetical protein [Haloferula sp.]|uniref:hypothetical protein n=1 Tax=Haloferula sp. TaxID=2497595 RepID=UPI00329BCFC4
MNAPITISLWMALTAIVSAGAPVQPTLTRYSKLWVNSVFTTPAEIVNNEVNPLEDYALGGISKLEDGYYAILLNRKKPDDKVVIYPGEKGDFEVVDVKWPTGSWRDAVVTVRNGKNSGTVEFEDKLLTVKTAPAKPVPQAKGKPPAKLPATISKPSANTTKRQPRPRVVVPKK